jgi:GcrA cell cycle regulator
VKDQNSKNTWTDEAIAILDRDWAAGESSTTIAIKISRVVGHHVSRSACCGKAHRRGLTYSCAHTNPNGPRQPRPQRRPAAHKPTPLPDINPLIAALAESGPIEAVADRPTPRARKLLELNDGTCRFPLGERDDPPVWFCGERTDAPPYCTEHSAIAYAGTRYVPIEERRERAREANAILTSRKDGLNFATQQQEADRG